jgi:GR25 family glycosyltransferase involved in LPS biosynthesis
MAEQLNRIGGTTPSVSFFEAHRPSERGEFESVGARGCFESHLAVLRSARDEKVQNLLLLEDDFDFTRDGVARAELLLPQLVGLSWDFFYGAHVLSTKGRTGLVKIPTDEPVLTASFVAFRGPVIPMIVSFLEAMAKRPAGSPEYGPMHVDGAYTTFRNLNPQ